METYDRKSQSVNEAPLPPVSPVSPLPASPGKLPPLEELRAAILETYALAHSAAEDLCNEPLGAQIHERHQVMAEVIERAAERAFALFEARHG